MVQYRRLQVGDPAPWFTQRTGSNPAYHLDVAAGRWLVLCFFGTAGDEGGRGMLRILTEQRELFDDTTVAFFGVSADPADEAEGRVRDAIPGIRFVFDFDGRVGRDYGALPVDAAPGGRVQLRRFWLVLDPTLRIRGVFEAKADGSDRHEVAGFVKALPAVDSFPGFPVQAPIFVLPDVFEPELCRRLVDLYETHGGEESGFMREVDGRTVAVTDHAHKRRSDYTIEDETLRALLQQRFKARVVPEIRKVHQFVVTRMERYIVACYDAASGGHFRAHRDNTTKGTAHRRFAVSVNLNDDFVGGEVSFPEYGPRSFKAPAGGAVVFSCSLLHAVSPVIAGKRYAFLPFLYDDAAARIREENNKYLGDTVGQYRQG